MADGSGPIQAALDAAAQVWPSWEGLGPLDYAIVVGFAGGGGSSLGIEQALGRHPDAALNHWPTAISVHAVNFPDAEHHCGDIMETDPRTVCPGKPVGLLWLSPDCRHFSKAKGGAPVSKRVRGLAWSAIPWIRLRRPRVVMIENVEEFVTWSPLIERAHPATGETELYPDPARKGETFARWTRCFEKMGYRWEVKVDSVAADYGAPTIRKRMIFIARCDGEAIVFPAPTHGPRDSDAVKAGRLKPYASAASIIDWSRECPSIFLTPEEARARGLKRPLAPATDRRIGKGLYRYTLANARPFIVKVTQRRFDADRAHGVDEPLKTVTTSRGGEFALVAPNMVRTDMASAKFAGQNSAEDPLRTVTSGGGLAVSEAALAPVFTGCSGRMAQTQPVDPAGPYPTITAKNDSCLATAVLVPNYSERAGQAPRCRSVEEPAATVVGRNNQGSLVQASLTPAEELPTSLSNTARPGDGARSSQVVSPAGECGAPCGEVAADGSESPAPIQAAYLTKFSENSIGQEPDEPLHTVMAGAPRHGVVTAHLEQMRGRSAGRGVDEPAATVTGRPHDAIVTAFMEQANTGMVGHEMAAPVSTVVEKGCTQRLVAAQLAHMRGSGPGQGDLAQPSRGLTASGQHVAIVESEIVAPSLIAYYGQSVGQDLGEGLRTVTVGDRFGLVEARLAAHGSPRAEALAAFLERHYGALTEADVADPLGSVESRARWGIVMVPDEAGVARPWQIVDIGMRMLDPATELAGAMGVRPDYVLTRDAEGRPVTKTDVTKMVGNMVCPPWAAAHVAANCGFLKEGGVA